MIFENNKWHFLSRFSPAVFSTLIVFLSVSCASSSGGPSADSQGRYTRLVSLGDKAVAAGRYPNALGFYAEATSRHPDRSRTWGNTILFLSQKVESKVGIRAFCGCALDASKAQFGVFHSHLMSRDRDRSTDRDEMHSIQVSQIIDYLTTSKCAGVRRAKCPAPPSKVRLQRSDIVVAINRRMEDIRAVYERHGGQRGSGDQIVVLIVISTSGRVSSATVTSNSTSNVEIEPEISSIIGEIVFPSFAGDDLSVSFPIEL